MKIHPIILYLLLSLLSGRYATNINVSREKLVGFMEDRDIINVGVIVDTTESLFVKVVESCVKMAIEDFYKENMQYMTRISLHIRDSMGDSLRSVDAALDLLETVNVHALILPIVSREDLFIASLADKANAPLLSFSSISSFDEHPYYLQVAGIEPAELYGIADLMKSFKWKECAIIYQATDTHTRQARTNLYKILLQNNISTTYQTPISLSSTNDEIVDELQVIMNMKTSIIVVHLSPSLASKVFRNAKMLGMMNKGFAWIVTSKTMDLLSSHDSSVHELMQGAIGFRSYISDSSKLQDFTLRWRKEFKMETRELNAYGLWAYDAVWALAHAIERAGIKPYHSRVQCKLLGSACLTVSDSGQALLTKIASSKFIGLAGVFELKNKKTIRGTYEILNVIGNGERRVGYWKIVSGLTKEIYPPNTFFSNSSLDLEPIIWPGISITAPESASKLVQINGKSLRVVIPSEMNWPELVSWRSEQNTNVTSADGFCVEVFRAAFEWLKYNISFEFFPYSNGTRDDLVNQVHLQNYDAAVGDITILAKRFEYVDFTSPFTDLGVGMVAKLDDKDSWFFTKPLDRGLWIICAIWFVVMGTIVWIIERPINDEFQGSLAQQVGTLLWFAASTLVYAQRERLQSNLSRFVVGIWLFVVLILTSSYTASLSSLLTVQKFKLSKNDYIGFQELAAGNIVNNLNFKDKLKNYNRAEDYNKALRIGNKNGGVNAIIDEMPYIKIFLGKYPNEYTVVQTSMRTAGFGFAFPKGSPLVPELSRAIAGLRVEGKLEEIEKRWFTGQLQMLYQENQTPSVNALSIDNFYGLFLLSGLSIALAGLLLSMIVIRGKLFTLTALAVQRLLLLLRRFHPRMTIG